MQMAERLRDLLWQRRVSHVDVYAAREPSERYDWVLLERVARDLEVFELGQTRKLRR